MTDSSGPTPLDFGVARRLNLFAQVVGELGARIVSGAIGPDDPFPKEADLEAQFGVSRSVIREAVKALAAKGLIESRPGSESGFARPCTGTCSTPRCCRGATGRCRHSASSPNCSRCA